MSLRVWLPLTKDLRQQGLDNISVTSHGATLNSTGKLGGCYYFSGDKQWLQFDTVLGDYYNNDWSIACWLKPTDSTRSVIISEYSAIGASNVGLELTTSRVVRLYWNGSPDINFTTAGALPINEWTHLTVTKQGRIVKVYFNGELKQTYTNSSDFSTRTSAAQPRIGDDYRGNSANTVSYQGYINDFRMYDHCLSPMEVKELAKGLILHYPFSTGNLINKNNIIDGYYLNSNGNPTATNGWCYTDYISINSNSHYLCTGLSKGGSGTYIVLYDSTKTKTRTILITANQDVDIITNNNEYYIRISIRKLLDELNTSAKFLYIDNIEYDCSGFCNNGTKVGTLTYSSDTAKYAVSTHFNGSSAIKDSTFPFSSAQWSVAFWYKFTTAPSAYQGFICLSRNAGADADKKFAAMPNSSYIWLKFESINYSLQSRKTNEWCHIVMTCDGTNGKVYENGILKYTTGSVGTILTDCDDLVVGARASSSDAATTGVYLNGNMSDVRIYATALSADDVKSLYQNSAYIDSSGNVYGAVHSEV